MNPDEVIAQVITDVESATAADVDVRTSGGDQNVEPPEAVLRWSMTRDDDANGHTPYAGAQTDTNGYNTAKEYHAYFDTEIDIMIRRYDEVEKEKEAAAVWSQFVPYEDEADLFHKDTRMWAVGDSTPSDNPMVNPDWYESTVVLNFQFISRVVRDGLDAIENITQDKIDTI